MCSMPKDEAQLYAANELYALSPISTVICMDVFASTLTAATMNSNWCSIYFFHSETLSAFEGCVWMIDL